MRAGLDIRELQVEKLESLRVEDRKPADHDIADSLPFKKCDEYLHVSGQQH